MRALLMGQDDGLADLDLLFVGSSVLSSTYMLPLRHIIGCIILEHVADDTQLSQ